MTNLMKRRAGAVLAAGLAAAAFASTANAATTPWTVSPSDNSGTAGNQLNAVSTVDATHAFAVGSSGSHGIAESWDGTRWNRMSTANPDVTDTLKHDDAAADRALERDLVDHRGLGQARRVGHRLLPWCDHQPQR
jgi:hypothetical protein